MLNIGYGNTVWLNGETKNHLDGIGVYSRELYQALCLCEDQPLHMTKFAFKGVPPCKDTQVFGTSFAKHLLKSLVLRQSFDLQNHQLALFHAPDHHIPFLNKVPVIATVMDLIPFLHPEWVSGGYRQVKNWLFKQMILSAQHIITISEYSKNDIVQHLGVSPDKISVTYLGVNQKYFLLLKESVKQEVLSRYQLSPGFFLFVGTLQPRKNLERLLEAHSLLPESYQKKHPIVLVGRAGWKVEFLIKKIEKKEANGTLKWLQYLPQDDVIALLQSALALTFVSLYEGFGLPVLEAFASQCPVMTSQTTSLPEVAGEAAYLVDPTDVSSIHNAMLDMIEHPESLVTLKEKGIAQANRFTWERCAKETLAVYQKVLSNN